MPYRELHLPSSPSRADVLRDRTKRMAVDVIKLTRTLNKASKSRIICNQVLRSATSVAANYRAVCRARSKREFISKLGVVIEEADETLFWLEMLVELQDVNPVQINGLTKEANELISIFVASKRTAEQSLDNRQSPIGNRQSPRQGPS